MIDTAQGRQRSLTQLRLKREILDTVMDGKADELKKGQIDKDRVRRGAFVNMDEVDKGDSLYRRYRGEAEKMGAGEAADRLEKLVQGWEETLPNTADLEDRTLLEAKIKTARSLYLQLIDEETQLTEKFPEKKPPEEKLDKPDEIIEPQEPQVQEESPESQAKELAEATRREGTGQLYGFVYPIDRNTSPGWEPGMGFNKGETITGNPTQYRELTQQTRPQFPPREVRDPYEHPNRQIWMVDQYGNGLLHITYDMYTDTPFDTRPGVGVNLNVVLPTELANKINAAVWENPNLADAYFKALFPGIVGPDGSTHIRRKPAAELLILDRRQNPTNTQGESRKFPNPIEY